MSIIGVSAQAIISGSLLAGLILPVVLAVALRVYRLRVVVGPERLREDDPALPMLMGVAFGFLAMMATLVAWSSYRGLGPASPGHPQVMPTPADSAFQSTVAPLVYFGTLLLVDWAFGGWGLVKRLGLYFGRIRIPTTIAQLWAMVKKGAVLSLLELVALLIILPPTYILAEVDAWFLKRVNYSHPPEHELLREMRLPQNPMIHRLLILAVVVVAPLCEEFLFRGHLQTLIRRMLVTMSSPHRSAVSALPVPVITHNPPVWQTWLAIVITSLLFAAVHPLWMAPPIFFLSLGLGYCYERTGNLWISMTVHSVFNSISTFVYLNLQQP